MTEPFDDDDDADKEIDFNTPIIVMAAATIVWTILRLVGLIREWVG